MKKKYLKIPFLCGIKLKQFSVELNWNSLEKQCAQLASIFNKSFRKEEFIQVKVKLMAHGAVWYANKYIFTKNGG